MSKPDEYDARDVLDRYIGLARQTKGRSPQDESVLPAPKPIIKTILLHVLRSAPEESDLSPVKRAYVELSKFQSLGSLSSAYIEKWSKRLDRITDANMSDAELYKAAECTGEVGAFLNEVQKRVDEERDVLATELAREGFMPFSKPSLRRSSSPNAAWRANVRSCCGQFFAAG